MILSHFTDDKPWSFGRRRKTPECYDPLHKPHGLWLSVDGEHDWPSWCEGEGWGLERLKQRHVFEIACADHLKIIETVAELDDFHGRYAVGRTPEMEKRYGREYIDWLAVSKDFGGIIIAPYQWDRRLSGPASRWYYGWDCASGCIWDLSAIRHVRTERYSLEDVSSTETASPPGNSGVDRLSDSPADADKDAPQ